MLAYIPTVQFNNNFFDDIQNGLDLLIITNENIKKSAVQWWNSENPRLENKVMYQKRLTGQFGGKGFA